MSSQNAAQIHSRRRRKPVRNLKGLLDRLASRDWAGIEPVSNGLPFKQLRHDERRIGLDADVVHRKDVGMVQRRGCVGLLLESTEAVGVGGKRGGQDLDRNVATQARVTRPIDLAHAARTQWSDDFVRAEAGAGGEGQA